VFCSEWSKMRAERSWGRVERFRELRDEQEKSKSPGRKPVFWVFVTAIYEGWANENAAAKEPAAAFRESYKQMRNQKRKRKPI